MNRQRKYLLSAILIPILMILIVAISLLFPEKKIIPPYNFLFAIGDNHEPYTCLQNAMAKFFPKSMNINFYKVEAGRCDKIKLYTYDFKTDHVTPITFAEAKKLRLQENLKVNSENYYISRNCYTGPDLGLFSMRWSYNDVCLTTGNHRQILNVNPGNKNELLHFIAIGWIVTEKSGQETKHE